ncbi:MAG: SEC-C metal-binding domain-containing protein [Chloroflexota bacterium]
MSESTNKLKPTSVLSTIVWTIFLFLLLFIALLIVTFIGSAGILLSGRILAQLFQVGVFEASLIALGVAVTAVFVFYRTSRSQHILEPADEDWDEEEDWDDEEEDFEDEEDDAIIPPRSRNDPCPCGSGKKYKYCHGKNA